MNEETPKPTLSQVLDYHVGTAGAIALEIADQQGHPFLTYSAGDYIHPLTQQARPVFSLLFAGPNAGEVGQRIAHFAKELLKIQPEPPDNDNV